MQKTKEHKVKIDRRANRVRKSVGRGTPERPRLSVFRSNAHIHAQLIDDVSGKTLVAASTLELKDKKGTKLELAREVGKMLAEKAKRAGITVAVFDRGSYRYHGRVKALAEGAREGKLTV